MNWLLRYLLLAVASALLLALGGCASSDNTASGNVTSRQVRPVPKDLAPGEQVDYAGHRCGNPDFHVKMHPCVFPLRRAEP